MKKELVLIASATFVVALAAAPGCSGDDKKSGGGGGGAIRNGTYEVSNAEYDGNCFGADSSFYEELSEVEITVSEDEMSMVFEFDGDEYEWIYEIDGTDLHDPTSPCDDNAGSIFDFRDAVTASANDMSQTYNCEIQVCNTYDGEINSNTSFTLMDSYGYVITTGNQCAAVVQTIGFGALPCADVDSADFDRT